MTRKRLRELPVPTCSPAPGPARSSTYAAPRQVPGPFQARGSEERATEAGPPGSGLRSAIRLTDRLTTLALSPGFHSSFFSWRAATKGKTSESLSDLE